MIRMLHLLRFTTRLPALVLATFMGLTSHAAAQNQETLLRIAAVVNEDIVSVYDVQTRIAFTMLSAGLPNTPEVQQRLLPQVVSALINERLKVQEAIRLEIAPTDEDVANSIANIERQRGMAPGEFLGGLIQAGVDPQTASEQIRSEVAWYNVMQADLMRQVNVTEEEVELVLRRLRANQGQPEHQVSEIFLPVSLNSEEQVRSLAERLVAELRNGAPFPAVARQFSQSPTAAVGGDLGWIHRGELEPSVDALLPSIKKGEVSDPVRSVTGYHIIAVRDVRTTAEPRPDFTILSLVQLNFSTVGPMAIPAEDIAAHTERAKASVTTCEDMALLSDDLKLTGTIFSEALYAGTLPAEIKDVALSAPINEVKGPVSIPGAQSLVIVCTRQPDDGLPAARQVATRLENEKVSIVAEQRLRDLRRQALIDVRL